MSFFCCDKCGASCDAESDMYNEAQAKITKLTEALYELSLKAVLAVSFHNWPGDPEWKAGSDLAQTVEKLRPLSKLGAKAD